MKYFAYCRKSSEDEERQALSIPAQMDEIKRTFSDTSDMKIIGWFEEKMSAKAPGRPVYAEMIKRIERGEADGIVAWHPDRLARNSVDGGWVIHLLDRRVLKDLKFVSYRYDQSPEGMFMLQIMFGQSKYYVDNLSVNVKRGMRKKIEMGWWANLAPMGYKNDRESNTIVTDPERFALLRRAWDMLLTDTYSVRQIHDKLTNEWGFRTIKRKKTGGGPVSRSALYALFCNPFYAGILDWHGEWRPGKHRAMVTLEEFNRAQNILRRPGKPKPETHIFAYTGRLIRCVCGLSVTAEEKIKRSGRHYVYYHCTRRSQRGRCPQPPVRVEAIEERLSALLESIRLPAHLEQFLQKRFEHADTQVRNSGERLEQSAQEALAETQRQLGVLVDLRVKNMIDDADYVDRRHELQKTEFRLREAAKARAAEPPLWIELGRSVILFRKYATDWFRGENLDVRRLVFKTVGSNSVLADGKASIQARFPFKRIEKPADCLRLCATLKELGTRPEHEEEVRLIIAAVRSLKELAETGRVQRPVPSPSRSQSKRRSARIRGKAGTASRERRPLSDRHPRSQDKAA